MLTGRRNIKVRTPRRIHNEDVDFDQSWKTLEASFREIKKKRASTLSYEALYRHAYKLVLKLKGEVLYTRVLAHERQWLSEDVMQRIRETTSGCLTTRNQADVGASTAMAARAAGEKFLKALRDEWADHQLCMNMEADVLMYMDRVYCRDHNQVPVYYAAMSLFRDCILFADLGVLAQNAGPPDVGQMTVLDLLNTVLLDQIQMERDGDMIDKHLLKSCVYMLEALHDPSTRLPQDVVPESSLYDTSFERLFLDSSADFYATEADRVLRDADAGGYCRYAQRRLREEVDRCRASLAENTTSKIISVVEDKVIMGRIQDVIDMPSGVRFMIDNEQLEELGLVYELNARVDENKKPLVVAIQKRIIELGTEINNATVPVSQPTTAGPSEGGGEENEKGKGRAAKERPANVQTMAAIKWVEEILALKDKFDRIHRVSLASDQFMQTALTKSFAEFINSFPRSSEYISLFIDDNMKKGLKGKTEAEVDTMLAKAIVLLRYVSDKDMFERYYKKHLSKRLLMNKSLSSDTEREFIRRMKIELGNNFTGKLEAMFRDMTISEELTTDFKRHVASLGDPDPKRVDLNINVLTNMTWPLDAIESWAALEDENGTTSGRSKHCIFPPEIDKVRRGFEAFYSSKHSGRKLTWLANMGTADLRATFSKVPAGGGATKEKKHELNVSTYGMLILLLFNSVPSGERLAYEDIQARTNIPSDDLIRNLQSLSLVPKTRILIKEPHSKDVKPTDVFRFNEGFQSNFMKVKVVVVAGGSSSTGNTVEGERERRETEKKLKDSRGFAMEAAIVRIMKQRKELSHSQLVGETIGQLKAQFTPDVNMIKKRIESLIEREYLERIEEATPPSYRYLA
ncbi:Cullin [Lineolata rhizophorae]|uniref:Cullin n=1 Tax=Lineolata rhizophorae TaxID=578093 RepID=A0A6A6P148_9PEZI|nr:Cullin [Lineolata rhizophorae]